jgi:hypothetical protein
MTAQQGPKSSSPLKRYLPVIAVVVIAAIVIGAIVVLGGDDDKKSASTTDSSAAVAKGPVPTYAQAQADGTVDNYDWGPNCNFQTGRVTLAGRDVSPCVPVFTGDNGGDLDPDHGVTADTIRIARYVPAPDAAGDFLAQSVGAYDSPEQTAATNEGFMEEFSKKVETYGRKIEIVPLTATGNGSDEQAAQADAEKAKELKVFAVLGGPAQTRSFAQTLANEGILCVGTCIIAQPGSFYKESAPYLYPGIAPDQTSALNVEFVKKQLAGKNAEFAGDPKYVDKKRSFVILSYDTPTGQFKETWTKWKSDLEDAVGESVEQVNYYLQVATVQADSQVIVQKLKAIDASTVIFTGDPFTPIYFTKEATKQGYFPEWVLSGTVFADTTVFSRQFDQQQWAHAFGMSLIPSRTPRNLGNAWQTYTECGTQPPPLAENTQAITYNNWNVLMTGIALAGPQLTPENFQAGLFAAPLPARDSDHLVVTVSYGDHGIWPPGTDYGGSDDTSLVWWDPQATGEDETGTSDKGVGQWRFMNGGARFRPGEIPTEPMPLFKTDNTVTYFVDGAGAPAGTKPVPDALKASCPLPSASSSSSSSSSSSESSASSSSESTSTSSTTTTTTTTTTSTSSSTSASSSSSG